MDQGWVRPGEHYEADAHRVWGWPKPEKKEKNDA